MDEARQQGLDVVVAGFGAPEFGREGSERVRADGIVGPLSSKAG